MTPTLDVLERPGDVPADVDEFLDGLRGPTLVRVAGSDRSRTRVVGGLLHGNEPSGLRAIHRVLRDRDVPATDLLVFVGAVEAARLPPRHTHRMPPGRRDLNRCFRPPFDVDAEGAVAERVLDLCGRPEAVVDLHNNSGRNPAYGVSARRDGPSLAVVTLFAPRLVHTSLRLGTFAEAFDHVAPSVTIECGRAHDPAADATALAGLRRFLRLPRIDPVFLPVYVTEQPMELLVDPVRVCLRPGVRIAFAAAPRTDVDVTFDLEIDRHNFETLAAGTALGWVRDQGALPIEAQAEDGRDRSREIFAIVDGRLVTRKSMVPIMMTTDPTIAMCDCLFYAAHRQQ